MITIVDGLSVPSLLFTSMAGVPEPPATIGAMVSTACTLWAAAVLALPAASLAALAATSTVTLPSNPAVGVTTRV